MDQEHGKTRIGKFDCPLLATIQQILGLPYRVKGNKIVGNGNCSSTWKSHPYIHQMKQVEYLAQVWEKMKIGVDPAVGLDSLYHKYPE